MQSLILKSFKQTQIQFKNIFRFSAYKPIDGESIAKLVGANPVRQFAIDFGAMEAKNKNCINMAVGVPIDPTPQSIVQAKLDFVQQSAIAGKNAYGDPRGIESLRNNLSEYYQQTYQLNQKAVEPDNLVITPGGTSFALSLTFELLLRKSNNEGEIIVLAPYFGPYTGMIKLGNGNPVFVDTHKNFLPNYELIEQAITKNTKALLINSPNNPTGKIYPKEVIEKCILICKKHDIALISDEIYEKFVLTDNEKFTTLAQFFQQYQDVNLIINTSPSKTYGMIGDRLGYIVGNQKTLIQDITITLGYRFASTPYLPQHAFDSVFKQENQALIEKYISETKYIYKEKADFLVKRLREIGFDCQEIEGGMFLMVEVKEFTGMTGTDFSKWVMQQEEAPLAISPGWFFGDHFHDYVRFTTCPTMDTLVKGCDQLEKYIKILLKDKQN